MSLKNKARKLAEALEDTVTNLKTYGAVSKVEYALNTVNKLEPAVNAFRYAVDAECSRDNAHHILTEIEQLMTNINGAATKGDMDFDKNNALNRYWYLKTIFQESRHRDEAL